MKVVFDVTSLLYGRGVSRYTANLYIALSRLPDVELGAYATTRRGLTQLLVAIEKMSEHLSPARTEELRRNLVVQNLPPTVNSWVWSRLRLNKIKKRFPGVDVFHCWDFAQPPDSDLCVVGTIHDLAMLKFPGIANKRILQSHEHSWQYFKSRGAHLIAVSDHTRQDAIRLLHYPPELITRVYEAVPVDQLVAPELLTAEKFADLQKRYGLTLPYFLFVGTREPRKNLLRLVKAWWPRRDQTMLVLVGASGWDEPDLIDRNLKILPAVEALELGLLYRYAQAFVYPSLDEGFGLPILESFAYGTPVMTSRGGATQEIAGPAAFLVDPVDVESIGQGLDQVLHLGETERAHLDEQMKKRLADFSWSRAAQETYDVYKRAVKDFYGR